jgi:integrase
MASLYRRGDVWRGKWSNRGKAVRRSLGTRDRREARRRLRELEAQTVRVERQTTSKETWDTAAADLLGYYQAYNTRNPVEAAGKVRTLIRHFHGVKLQAIDASAILEYVAHRKREGKAANTVNLELATLRRALRLAQECGKLDRVGPIRMLKPAPARSGFFERDAFEAVCAKLPRDLVLVARIAHTYGWRINSEVLPLTRRQVDLDAGTLRLEAGTTKNREGRMVYLTPELKALFTEQLARVTALERDMSQVIPWVFPVTHGAYRGGPRRDIRKVWWRACREAGVPGRLKHDLRRTAARNMINAGVPERVAMAVLGHKTPSMLHRYCIVSPGDLQDVARRLSDNTRHNLATAAA